MEEQSRVLEYKCPCCNAALVFGGGSQKLTCEYCGNTFDVEAVRAFNESESASGDQPIEWQESSGEEWIQAERQSIRAFQCPSCGGEILTDETTAATFCPYCENPTILPTRLSGNLKPNAVIPFQTSKDDAKAAFLRLCKGKPLLPKGFTQEQRLEKITGMYVPFWLYDCDGSFDGNYRATRVHRWSDSRYHYTRTEHFLLRREGDAGFSGIPMDASSKMDDTFMESIEPYDYAQIADFNMAYLSGYLANKYDVPSQNGEERIRQRVEEALQDQLQSTLVGYDTVIPASRRLRVQHSKSRYALLPVWMLNTRYRGKLYTFAMNGQTGKLTGSLPICPKRAAAWFAGVCAGVTALAYLAQWIFR